MPLQQTTGSLSADAYGVGQAATVNYIEDVFSTYLYTGNGSTQTITNGIDLAGKGGLVWNKSRSNAYQHSLTDTVRGAGNSLDSSDTAANDYSLLRISAFNADGFTMGGGSRTNASGATYASWTFRKQPKFFDVVTYTGDGQGYFGTNLVSHSLASVPGCVIIKRTDSTGDWFVFTRNSSGTYYYLVLNSTASAAGPYPGDSYGLTSTTIDVAKLNDISTGNNINGASYVMYLFAHNAGGFGLTGTDNVISCGSYTGTGANGNAVTLGYEPQWIIVKNTTAGSGDSWWMMDSMRGLTVLPTNSTTLRANVADAELGPSAMGANILSPTATGFEANGSSSATNGSGQTYIYIAIRRGPMKVPTDGTKVFNPTASSAATGTVVTTGFPPDTIISNFRAGYANNSIVADRLRGALSPGLTGTTPWLQTATTDAERAGNVTNGWDNTGFAIPSMLGSVSSIYWTFGRAPGFFDEVCYTGTGATQTLNHNLGASPELLIAKKRNTTNDWYVLFPAGGSSARAGYLDATNAFTGASATVWGNGSSYVAPTSTQVTVGSYYSGSDTAVMYLFASCPGVSKVGSYTGTGAAQTINCGFTGGARFVLIKRTDSTGDWYVWDTARGMVSGTDPYLLLDSTAAEVNANYVFTSSTGFTIQSGAPAAINASGGTFIFLAIA